MPVYNNDYSFGVSIKLSVSHKNQIPISMDKVIAVVVTYNRQLLLSQCIAALRKQTRKIDRILVINNGSSDNTEAWLKSQPDVEFITQDNLGGAGGFYRGIKTAYEKSFDWIWVMDDDGYPKEDALEKLLEGDDEELCLRNCSVINKDDKKSFVWKTGNYTSIDQVPDTVIKNVANPFNGTLLHRKVIERVGFPNPDLFLWGDETEYFYRIIRKNKIPYYTKATSIHYHPASAYSYKNDWNFRDNWKMYFYVRNRFFILKTKFSTSLPVAFVMYIGFLIAFAGTVIVFQKTSKFKKLGFIFWPMTDALTNNCKATPSFILQRISTSSPYRSGNYWFYQIRSVRGIFSQLISSNVGKLKKA
jgi:rhamnopyranosyl-N-acetylglucosaminyl-diphospho-decaprenol beta-1,3/1,4-galactofuranosyltransferase